MPNKDNIDLNIILSFTNLYERLYVKGEINEEQLEKVLLLLENHQNHSSETFQKELNKIFN